MENITLTTSDGLKIAATFYSAEPDQAAICLHVLRKNRQTYKLLAKKLQASGISTLAIDFRGHGESDGNWQNFSADNFNKMILDVGAGFAFLKTKNDNFKIGIVGASIGANTALNFAADNSQVAAVVLLSPGLDYHGVRTEKAIQKYSRPIFLAASKDDSYSYESTSVLASRVPSKDKKLAIFESAGHGTNMFEAEIDLPDQIVNWLRQKLI